MYIYIYVCVFVCVCVRVCERKRAKRGSGRYFSQHIVFFFTPTPLIIIPAQELLARQLDMLAVTDVDDKSSWECVVGVCR